ncbi:TPA: head-tail adaptor protein, partial [Enterococcus faecium]|nr:head-tail adaptor protein [Enterococcus faecium]
MANNRRLEETFNDGWLKILTQTTKRNELGKKI